MKTYLEYYNDLYENVPEEWTTFGRWSENIYYDLVNEGLITSYPRSVVVRYLINMGNKFKTFYVENAEDILDEEPISIQAVPSLVTIEEFNKELNNKLSVYGYFVGKTTRISDVVYRLSIEIKLPELLDASSLDNDNIYHITHRKHLDKIMRIGLIPKDSTTSFTHPGGRIYMIQTASKILLDRLKSELLKNRLKNSQSNLDTDFSRTHSKLHHTPENMITLKITLPPDIKLYNDPMFPKSNNYKVFFVTNNIPPECLKLLDPALNN